MSVHSRHTVVCRHVATFWCTTYTHICLPTAAVLQETIPTNNLLFPTTQTSLSKHLQVKCIDTDTNVTQSFINLLLSDQNRILTVEQTDQG